MSFSYNGVPDEILDGIFAEKDTLFGQQKSRPENSCSWWSKKDEDEKGFSNDNVSKKEEWACQRCCGNNSEKAK